MKKTLLFAAALFAAVTLNAQTIVIDGANDDWADVPMLTEPGVSPVAKMLVPQTDVTLPTGGVIAIMVEGTNPAIVAGYPVLECDADNSNTTGNVPWFFTTMGVDYELATWSSGSTFAANSANTIREMCIANSAFSGISFGGSFAGYLTFNWGELYLPASPEPTHDNWKWSETSYHPYYVAPYSLPDLNGAHAAADAYSTHQVLTPGAALNMKVAGSENDTALWASWAVELKTPAVYTISADVTSTNSASVDLALVNMATNAIVASFRSESIWAPTGATAFGEFDLSSVPVGKYMLKFSNHVAWSEMVLSSITLTAKGGTAIDNAEVQVKAEKVIRDGQVLIIRDGKTFNALGAEVK